MMGLPELRKAVSAHYQHWQNLDFDPDSEIMVTSGATEAIAGALMALIEPGDEVVLFQPLYDAYLPLVQRAGGVPRFVRLEPPHWRFDEEKLARAFTPKTRVVLFNNPLNPSATVSRARISNCSRATARNSTRSRCATRCGSTSCSTARRHHPLIAMPGMRERCVKIGSAGKIFSLTGWKVGFVCAAPACCACWPRRTSTSPSRRRRTCRPRSPTGSARRTIISRGCARDLQRSRDRFTAGLRSLGFPVIDAEATYFVNVDLASLGLNEDDESFCKRLVLRAQGRGDPGLGVLRQRSDPLGGALLLRQARRDARCRAGTARRRAQAGGVNLMLRRGA